MGYSTLKSVWQEISRRSLAYFFRQSVQLIIVSIGGFVVGCSHAASIDLVNTSPVQLSYHTYALPHHVIQVLQIPQVNRYEVIPVLATELRAVEQFAQTTGAIGVQRSAVIAVLNGGFFDPVNQLSTSYVTIAGKQVADPQSNRRLMDNADLKPFLSQILNRSEFRQYRCGQQVRYDIVRKKDSVPKDCQLWHSLGAGPQLLPTMTLAEEGFWLEKQGTVLRDPLGNQQRNARSAIGITAKGDLVWVMVAQKTQDAGLTLVELANFMRSQGVEKAMNLDGGTSSSFYYHGKTVYGKVDESGTPIKRPVKSALLLLENSLP